VTYGRLASQDSPNASHVDASLSTTTMRARAWARAIALARARIVASTHSRAFASDVVETRGGGDVQGMRLAARARGERIDAPFALAAERERDADADDDDDRESESLMTMTSIDGDEMGEDEGSVVESPFDGGGGGVNAIAMWLMAVPKRKVTPSRRKRRNQFKRVPFIEEVVRCRVCGKANMPHVHCCVGVGGDERRTETPKAGE